MKLELPTGWSHIDGARWWILQPECGETSRAYIEALLEAVANAEHQVAALRFAERLDTENGLRLAGDSALAVTFWGIELAEGTAESATGVEEECWQARVELQKILDSIPVSSAPESFDTTGKLAPSSARPRCEACLIIAAFAVAGLLAAGMLWWLR